ncbi:MAG: hypothetical protein ABDH20_01470 [Thermus sp.]
MDELKPEEVPLAMRLANRWVVWRLEEVQGRRTKVPYQPRPGGKKARSNDPRTWGEFHEALAWAERGFHGIGFVLGEGFVGVDLDQALGEAWAEEILARAPGPVELSPSGKGFHIYLRGQIRRGWRRKASKGGIEVYGEGRFFTVTGRWLHLRELPGEEKTREFLTWLEARFPQPSPPPLPATKSAPQPEEHLTSFLARKGVLHLWYGQWQGQYPSQSEADLALASYLVRFTGGNLEEADRLFRASGLYRPKWDELRGTTTYGQRTLERALMGAPAAR